MYHRKKGSGVCITERKVLSVIHTLPQVLSLRRVYRREKGPLPQESVSQRERSSPSGECIAERKVLSLRRVYRREKGSLPQVSVSQRERFSPSGECIRREKGSLPQESVSQRERFSPSGECIAECKCLCYS